MKLSEIIDEIKTYEKDYDQLEIIMKTYQPHDKEITLNDGTKKTVEKWEYDIKWFAKVKKDDWKRIEIVLSQYLIYQNKILENSKGLEMDKPPLIQINALKENDFVGVVI